MSRTQRKYDHEYKIQAVKLAREIGGAKAAKELGIPEGTIHTWLKAVRAGTLDIGDGAHTPESAMSLAEELAMLRKRVKDQDKDCLLYTSSRECSFYDALRAVDLIPNIGRGQAKLESFVAMIEHFKNDVQDMSVSELMEEVIKETGYIDALIHECESEEATSRIENIDELRNKIAAYEENCETQNEASTLSGFLEDVALVADIDSLDESTDYVVLMTCLLYTSRCV